MEDKQAGEQLFGYLSTLPADIKKELEQDELYRSFSLEQERLVELTWQSLAQMLKEESPRLSEQRARVALLEKKMIEKAEKYLAAKNESTPPKNSAQK